MKEHLFAVEAGIDFAEQYLALRKKEGRIYSDEELAQLPAVRKDHPLEKEWKVRERSCRQLFHYLSSKKITTLLEIGCGNGWLSNRMAQINNLEVTGIDINFPELEQARKVFRRENLHFHFVSPEEFLVSGKRFDCIVFASSIQYFSSVQHILRSAQAMLRPGGEIHVIDSNFYRSAEKANAAARSSEYFESMNASAMRSFYFHHTIEDLAVFNYTIMNKVFMKLGMAPFPWIRIRL